jgi:single-strand DNA-binding protein
MSQDNQITLRGYLTADPRFRQSTPMAIPRAEIRMGSTPRRLNRETGEWQDGAPSYYNVTCWRRLAVNAVSSLHKGDRVVVRGKINMRTWVDNQQRPRVTVEIEADTLGHDLAYGWTHYMPGVRQQAATRTANGDEQATQGQDPANQGDGDEGYAGESGWGASAGAEPGTDGLPDEDTLEADEVDEADEAADDGAEGADGTDDAADAGVLAGVRANLPAFGLPAEAVEPELEPALG